MKTNTIHFHLSGENPTARDLANFLNLAEVSLFWGTYVSSKVKHLSSVQRIEVDFYQYIEQRYRHSTATAIAQLAAAQRAAVIDTMYRNTLRISLESKNQEYSKIWGGGENVLASIHRELSEIVQKESSSFFPSNQNILQYGADARDISDWLADRFGNRLTSIKKIQESNSLDIILNAANYALIFGLQDHALSKDVLTYTVGLFQAWLGNHIDYDDRKLPNDIQKIPNLPKSMAGTIEKYSEVNIEVTQERILINLKR